MKKGLVMEGGAMRGLFTAGVIDVLMENNIEFDGAVGVSAGAAFGCNIKSKQIGRALRYNKKYCNDKRYCSLHSLITTGDMYGVDFCYRDIPDRLDIFDNETYNSNPLEFHVVASDVLTGKAVYKKCDKAGEELLNWIRASASMPLVSKIVEFDGNKLLDGGICDSIPIKYFEEQGFEKNVVILTQPENYIKKKNSLMPIIKVALKKYPKIVEAMARRHEMYNETTEYIRKKEKSGDILVIRPESKLIVGRTEKNPEKLQAVYDLGYNITKKRLFEITEFLK